MENIYPHNNESTINLAKAALMLSLSVLFMGASCYLNLSYILELERFSLSVQEKYVVAIMSSIGLPLLLLIVTQLWLEYRGLKNAIRSVLGGAVITLLGCVPIAFAAIEGALA
ncbi:hypothetical protein [uncultured Alteromonas sp.]|jgi:hypothetical protein|uniref:hypothetical protein n=1 Tax=uncultured Alteromonas sp. TaxID=179113 RepID=UPI0025FFEF1D|nr:hypothetical protein [uncultured Alteromonas sp.]